jgi:hypothetical protein
MKAYKTFLKKKSTKKLNLKLQNATPFDKKSMGSQAILY